MIEWQSVPVKGMPRGWRGGDYTVFPIHERGRGGRKLRSIRYVLRGKRGRVIGRPFSTARLAKAFAEEYDAIGDDELGRRTRAAFVRDGAGWCWDKEREWRHERDRRWHERRASSPQEAPGRDDPPSPTATIPDPGPSDTRPDIASVRYGSSVDPDLRHVWRFHPTGVTGGSRRELGIEYEQFGDPPFRFRPVKQSGSRVHLRLLDADGRDVRYPDADEYLAGQIVERRAYSSDLRRGFYWTVES